MNTFLRILGGVAIAALTANHTRRKAEEEARMDAARRAAEAKAQRNEGYKNAANIALRLGAAGLTSWMQYQKNRSPQAVGYAVFYE